MSNITQDDQELDQFFTRLRAKLPKSTTRPVPPPSQGLLELAKQAAKSHREYLFDHGLYHETLPLPWAASDGEDVPFQLDGESTEWSITREFISGNETQQMLKWRCHKEYRDTYEQRRIVAQIGKQTFDLGEVFDGIAQRLIPRNLDLAIDKVTISIKEKL